MLTFHFCLCVCAATLKVALEALEHSLLRQGRAAILINQKDI